METSSTHTVDHGVGSKTSDPEDVGCMHDQSPSHVEETKEEADKMGNNLPTVDDAFQDMVNAAQKAELAQNDTTEAWAAVLKAMVEFDERLTKDWKDDLQNMLIFAGLFSAVATAFVIESYTWIQEDPADTSAQVLIQVSHQLSSLTLINGVLTFTAPPAVPPPFTPQPIYIRINMLWFLSLAMSLVAALLAIVIQQWMLVYQSSAYTSVQQAVRLRQLRYYAMRRWGVPWIVATVPILLQVALTLFFAGGWLFLQSLNKTVFTPYATLIAISLGALGGSFVASSISSRCPYKSPLSCAVSLILEIAPKITISIPLVLYWTFIFVACMILFILTFAFLITFWSLLLILFCVPFMLLCTPCILLSSESPSSWLIGTLRILYNLAPFSRMWSTLLNSIKSLRHLALHSLRTLRGDLKYASTGPTDYWHACERELVTRTDPGILDSKALSWVLPFLFKNEYSQLKHCLGGLSSPLQLEVIAEWIAQNVKLPTVANLATEQDPSSNLFGQVDSSALDQEFISHHLIDIIMDILPDLT
ncbi:hypothetical protein NM688_g7439 [Phlebia brevispora]|uniref:Uncharacterized protein n=1 Tax=Phlebia brevispora TaxID=194682 RepID=A0ACC1S5E3_9APHY|nr:hypothetical protein NM688_g7439 [Phlebia brevispora]